MDNIKPLLLGGTKVKDNIVQKLGTSITIEDFEHWDNFTRVLKLCDGTNTVCEISSHCKIDEPLLMGVLVDLEKTGFIWMLEDYQLIPLDIFNKEFKAFKFWLVEEMYSQSVWEDLYKGKASSAIMVGWAVENMHYTRTVIEHMTIATTITDNVDEQKATFKHLSEEWDHYFLFKKGCISVGISEKEIEGAVPLASTRAITSYMRRVALKGPIIYNACEALLEATTDDNEGVVNFLETVGKNLELPETFTRELVRHVKVDADFGHIDNFDNLLSNLSSLDLNTIQEIFNCCERLAQLFVIWNSEIADYYGKFQKPKVRNYID